MRIRSATAAAVLRVVAAGTCWGLSAVMAKSAFDRGVPPVRMAEARVAVALFFLVLILAWRGGRQLRLPAGTLPPLIGFGLCVAGVNAAYYIAIDRLAVGVAVSLQYTAPVLLLGLAALTSRRHPELRPRRLAWVAAALTLAGAVLVSRAFEGFRGVDGPGLAAGGAAALLFAGYLLTAGRAGRRGVPPVAVLFWGFVVAVAAWTVFAPWWSWPVAKLAQPKVALAVLGVGLIGTLLPFFLAVGAIRTLTPAAAGTAATVEPPAAALFAWIFLGQHLSAAQLAGGALVIAGVVVAHRTAVVTSEALAVEPAA